jgi:hypothetical protein
MPDGVNQKPGDLETVRKRFSDWDPRYSSLQASKKRKLTRHRISKMLEHVGSVLEWRVSRNDKQVHVSRTDQPVTAFHT